MTACPNCWDTRRVIDDGERIICECSAICEQCSAETDKADAYGVPVGRGMRWYCTPCVTRMAISLCELTGAPADLEEAVEQLHRQMTDPGRGRGLSLPGVAA